MATEGGEGVEASIARDTTAKDKVRGMVAGEGQGVSGISILQE